MSFEAIGYVKQLELGSLEDPAKRLLLITIAENTFNDSFRCKIEQKQLAHDCARVSDKTISRHLKKLETAKIIKRYRRHLKQGGRLPDAIEILGFEEHYNKRKAEEEKKSREREADTLSVSGTEPDSLSTGQSSDPTPRQQVSVSIRDPVLSGTEDKISPPTPQRKRRGATASVSAQILGEGGPHRHVVEIFVGPLYESKVRPKGIENAPAFLRSLRDGLGSEGFTVADLQQAHKVLDKSRTVMPGLPECLKACRQAKAERRRAAIPNQAPQGAHCRRDPSVAARSQELQKRLRSRLGDEAFDAWFSDLECENFGEGALVLSVSEPFRRTWIGSHFQDHLQACCEATFPGLSRVEIVVRPPAREAAA